MPFNTIGFGILLWPTEEHIVGCKWVFSVKCLADDSVDRYKARFLTKGFTQIAGKDFWPLLHRLPIKHHSPSDFHRCHLFVTSSLIGSQKYIP